MSNENAVEQQGADPSLPQRSQSGASKTQSLLGTAFNKLLTKHKQNVPHPFESVYPMRPGSAIVSGVEFGDQTVMTDTSPAPPVLAPSDKSKSDYHLWTFVARSAKYRLAFWRKRCSGRPR